jgi:hypothetical protein
LTLPLLAKPLAMPDVELLLLLAVLFAGDVDDSDEIDDPPLRGMILLRM